MNKPRKGFQGSVLTSSERKRLNELKDEIDVCRKNYVVIGHNLIEILESRLYRGEHKTFGAYTKATWGWNRGRAYQYVDAAIAYDFLEREGFDVFPSTENTMRYLVCRLLKKKTKTWIPTKDSERRIEKAWYEIVRRGSGRRITGVLVEQVIDEMFPEVRRPKPEQEKAVFKAMTALVSAGEGKTDRVIEKAFRQLSDDGRKEFRRFVAVFMKV